ncbi:DUF364 domain-containing protein [Alkalibaculum bacchi]|jgi:uncharacterized protein (DUF4213/DUF364 family)|uniref:DUF364 domain-containing protein n=1 Tax=Alkalibaculum bacchi TaxID=645887 RepID=UPI0026EE8631|nr:DUF364 domain-containing protein [Alkalibaculum bacchi]
MNNGIFAETIEHVKEILGEDTLEKMTVERAVLGLFFSGVKLSDGHGGLCFTPIKEIPEAVCCPSSAKAMPLSGRLSGRSVKSYLEDIFSDNVLKKTLGIATLNALSSSCWDKMKDKGYEIQMGIDTFDDIELQDKEKTVVVGALTPMLKKLIAANADFNVLEMDSSTLKSHEMPYFMQANRAGEVVPQADLLVITGTTLINDTLEGLLSMAKPGAEIVVTGPTVSMLPDAFFFRGVTSLGGIVVTDADALLDIISEGGSGYHFFGKFADRSVIKSEE